MAPSPSMSSSLKARAFSGSSAEDGALLPLLDLSFSLLLLPLFLPEGFFALEAPADASGVPGLLWASACSSSCLVGCEGDALCSVVAGSSLLLRVSAFAPAARPSAAAQKKV